QESAVNSQPRFKPNIETHPTLALTAHATADRYVVPRELLLKANPDCARILSATASRRLLEWYALRARRPAWPDVFLGRIRPAQGMFERILDPFGDELEVRVSIVEASDELTSEPYHIAIFFVVDEEVWIRDTTQRSAIQSAFAKFVSALKGCVGISIDEEKSGVFSGAEFSWQQTRLSDEWNFANLSYSD
ncbi:MAG TPA: hypothetical protein VFN67_42560, partial [Polyangiales bacterium]|nr:hypothetical protein [Polyangiales bacterium]